MARLSKKVLLAVAIAMAAISVQATVPQPVSTFGQGVAVNSAASIAGINVGIGYSTSQAGIGSTKGNGLAAGAASGFGIGSQTTGSGAGFVASQALNSGDNSQGSAAATNQAAFRGASTSSGQFDLTSSSQGSTDVGKTAGQASGAAGVGLDGGLVNVNHVSDVAVTVGNKQSALFTSSGQVAAGDTPYVAVSPYTTQTIVPQLVSVGPTGSTAAGVIGSTTSASKQAYTAGGVEASGASDYTGNNGFGTSVAAGQYASQSRPGQSIGYGVAQASGLGVGDSSTSGPTSSKVGFTSYGANGISGSSNNFGSAQTN